ncbi:LysR family transcriptional regulator [Alkalihalobacillus sp. LMS39]|uniref:LysR family transcriptional regulator n=1 Tax=Alkalihalobacillus sp. LMS39 TaxID=2924032 RepID=UPI001FB4A9CF|nr:LysR family transcriptional regulator [Alkalihalobacillus sp. LMS39]UOE96145.1 LysR family transcriptional regulator [Alkalihalobacillus sp. LMS39]
MNLNWLYTFVTAAQFENFYKTAETLYLSQPTVTVHIKQLEKELGTPLFERKGRNIVLTTYGKEFLPHATKIIETLSDGLHHIENVRQGYHQTLSIAVSPLIASTYLPYWIKKFIRYYPDIEVVVHVMESHLISEEVERGTAHLGLARMESKTLGLTCVKIYEEPLKIVAPHDGGDWESSIPLDLETIVNKEVLLTYNHPEYWDSVLFELKHLYRHVRTMKVTQVHVTKRFIEEGIGFSILPRSTVKRELAEGRMLEVEAPFLSLPTASTYVITKDQSEEASQFMSTVRSLI